MHTRFLQRAAVSLFFVLLSVSTVQATQISFSDEHVSSQTDWTDTLSVSQFSSSLGTLNSVTLGFEERIFSDMTLDNDNTTGVNVIGNVNVSIFLTSLGDIGGSGFSTNATGTTGLVSLAGDDSGDTDGPMSGGPDEVMVSGISGSDSVTLSFNAGDADFSHFIGEDLLSTVGLSTFGGFGVSGGGGNVDVNVNTFAEAALTVTYDFTPSDPGPDPAPVPEPATLFLFGSGMLGMTVWRWKNGIKSTRT